MSSNWQSWRRESWQTMYICVECINLSGLQHSILLTWISFRGRTKIKKANLQTSSEAFNLLFKQDRGWIWRRWHCLCIIFWFHCLAVHASVKIPLYSTPRLNPSSRSCASTVAPVPLQPSILLHLHVEPADSQQTLALACDKLVTLDALALRSENFLLSVWGFIHLYI